MKDITPYAYAYYYECIARKGKAQRKRYYRLKSDGKIVGVNGVARRVEHVIKLDEHEIQTKVLEWLQEMWIDVDVDLQQLPNDYYQLELGANGHEWVNFPDKYVHE